MSRFLDFFTRLRGNRGETGITPGSLPALRVQHPPVALDLNNTGYDFVMSASRYTPRLHRNDFLTANACRDLDRLDTAAYAVALASQSSVLVLLTVGDRWYAKILPNDARPEADEMTVLAALCARARGISK